MSRKPFLLPPSAYLGTSVLNTISRRQLGSNRSGDASAVIWLGTDVGIQDHLCMRDLSVSMPVRQLRLPALASFVGFLLARCLPGQSCWNAGSVAMRERASPWFGRVGVEAPWVASTLPASKHGSIERPARAPAMRLLLVRFVAPRSLAAFGKKQLIGGRV